MAPPPVNKERRPEFGLGGRRPQTPLAHTFLQEEGLLR